MAKACLIYPRDLNLNFFPLGIGYIASSLIKNNHQAMLLDITRDDLPLLDKLRDYKPDIVGISITTPQLKLAKMTADHIRRALPGVPIVVGGIHPSYFKETFLNEFDADFVIYGEGEDTMRELCDSVKNGFNDLAHINGLVYKDKDGRITVNPPRRLIEDLNSIPFPARELVNYETYLQPPGIIRGIWTNRCGNITTSRGCPGRCTYCGVNYLYGNAYRRRSVDNVLEEIDMMVSRYGIDGLYFMDDTFLMGTGWIEEFSEKFIARKYNLVWSCYGRVDTVNERILSAIKRAGCVQVEYGIESCSERVLRSIKKKTSFEQTAKAVKMTKDNGMRALGSFIFGFADDSVEDLKETISLASKIDLDFMTCFFATPYPGSELYEQAVKEDRILEHDMSNWYVRNSNIWRVNLDEETIAKYRNIFLKSYRYKNILFFIKNPIFLLQLFLFMLKNSGALLKSLARTVKERCPDDFGYYFYIYLSKNLKARNKISGEERLSNEVKHGAFLSKRGAEDVWNRNTAAGRERWARRIGMLSAHIKPSMKVLEVGCGVGSLTRELAKTHAAITAIDVSPDLVKLASSAVDAPNVTFKLENAYSTDFREGEFDTIIGSAVLHHLDIDKALSEFHRILKKGGTIFFTEPNMLNPQIMIQKNIPFIKKMMGDSPDETAFFRWSLKKRLEKRGFTDITIVPFDFLHPATPEGLITVIRPICGLAEKVPVLSEIAGSLYITAKK